MTTTLPPINKSKNASTTSRSSKRSQDGLFAHISQNASRVTPTDKFSLQKSSELRSKLPVLRKHDIAKFRNTYKHNLCLDMLTAGYHMSFCSLVNLIRYQTERREAAGPESLMWTKPMLQDETEKLDMLHQYMTKAEYASRVGNIEAEYKAWYNLAQSFTDNPDYQWLLDHFYATCLEVAKKDGRETRMLAEGYCNVGLSCQYNQKYNEALKHFEAYHKLAKSHQDEDWRLYTGTSFYVDSCTKLYHIYTICGMEKSRTSQDSDQTEILEELTQALEMAKQSQDKKLEGEASYILGLAYQKANMLDTAMSHLFNFYDSCQGDSNSEGIGRACDAIAKIYARKGNKEKSVEFLKRFVQLTEKTGLEKEYCLACNNLGNVCNSVGNYNEATEYFSKAYNISRALNDPTSTNSNRVQYGIAMAHRMMGKFANHIMIGDLTCMTRLLDWKCVRTDEFNKPIPSTVPGSSIHVLIPPPLVEDVETEEHEKTGDGEEEDSFSKDEAELQQDGPVASATQSGTKSL